MSISGRGRGVWSMDPSRGDQWQEINPEYSLEGLMLKFQYFGHLMRRADHWERP